MRLSKWLQENTGYCRLSRLNQACRIVCCATHLSASSEAGARRHPSILWDYPRQSQACSFIYKPARRCQ
ncbi:hypothetical protein IF1G_08977 [Cordyceps javanica]|uniref:Uncharacterized protein n=1 Tax=Cordyceps javanica TaxID=43265 RepID=A0A545USK6_9HYPO|nr:hypothetical protein IF1G_08977 [Cordyceps javanica]